MRTFWVSFAGAEPTARVVLLDGEDEIVARVKAHLMGFYRPGDEVLIVEVPEGEAELALPRNRVLTEEELEAVGAIKLGAALDRLN